MGIHRKKWLFALLKLIGIGLFLWILSQIDRGALAEAFRNVHWALFTFSFSLQFVIYVPKAHRLHLLIRQAALAHTWYESWVLYNLGIFWGTVTPGKLGELGRAAKLKQRSMHAATALSVLVIDRIADVAAIAVLGILSIGMLFGPALALGLTGMLSMATAIAWVLWKKTHTVHWLQFAHTLSWKKMVTIGCVTLLGWLIYFCWAILVARSIGIAVPIHVLIASFIVAGLVALLPIAPSGFGTRDAALLTMLVPYGVAPEQVVTLGLLMFVSIVLSALPGGVYWVTERRGTS